MVKTISLQKDFYMGLNSDADSKQTSVSSNEQSIRLGRGPVSFGGMYTLVISVLIFWGCNASLAFSDSNQYYECKATNCHAGLGVGCPAIGTLYFGTTSKNACTRALTNACPNPGTRLTNHGSNGGAVVGFSESMASGVYKHAADGLWEANCQFEVFSTGSQFVYALKSSAIYKTCPEGEVYNPHSEPPAPVCIDCETFEMPMPGGCELFEKDDKKNGPPCDAKTKTDEPKGNPCFPGSGNKYQREVDYSPPGSDISIVRHYNSRRARFDGAMGHGWTNSVIPKNIQPIYFEGEDDLLFIRQENGFSEKFVREDGTSEWVGDLDTRLIVTNQGSDILITYPNGGVDLFNENGALQSETTATSKETSYHYNNDGLVERVSYPYGHEIIVFWNSDERIERITNPHGQDIVYSYDGNGNLERVTYDDPNYAPDSLYREYFYGAGSLVNHLEGIQDERGIRYADFRYETDTNIDFPKALSTEHATTTNGVSQERFSFDYQ